MIFNNKFASTNKSKTPVKNPLSQTPVKSILKKQNTKNENVMYPSSKNNSSQKQIQNNFKYKTKDSFIILQHLQQIYSQLSFNEYEIFSVDNIEKAKQNIDNLCTFLGEKPICRKHRDLLNLYCENQKEVICVSCVYKPYSDHKSHKVKSIESVQKILDYETIRNQQKSKGLANQLTQIKQQIDIMTKEMGQNYMMISKYTVSIIEQSIKELTAMKVDMEKKLSLSYRRTTTVMNRYSQALELMINHIDHSMQRSKPMNPLSKHMLLKELTTEAALIEELVNKFTENRMLMDQWRRSNNQFTKLVLTKRNSINSKQDAFVVTEF